MHSDADPKIKVAAQRLFERQLITRPNGGYLTAIGYEAAVHIWQALQIVCSVHEPVGAS